MKRIIYSFVLCFFSIKMDAQLEDFNINNVKVSGDTMYFSQHMYSIGRSIFSSCYFDDKNENLIFSLADSLWFHSWILNSEFLVIGFIDNSWPKHLSLVPLSYKHILFINFNKPDRIYSYWNKSEFIGLTDILRLDSKKEALIMKNGRKIFVDSIADCITVDNSLKIAKK